MHNEYDNETFFNEYAKMSRSRDGDSTMQSYFGMLGHCASRGLQKWIENNIIFKRRDSELSQEVNTWT